MIKGSHLTRTFIRQNGKKTEPFDAVSDVSLEAGSGEILGILGPNGAGKTTLLRMLGNLMEPTKGQVIYFKKDGSEIRDLLERKSITGYLSENTKLYRRMTVREMLTMFGELSGMDKEKAKERVEEVSGILSMNEFLDNRTEKLSTGQTQRASIARCLMHDPEVYIFDEPTLGLDVYSAKEIIDFMRSEKERGKTVLYSTHYMEEAEFLCDRIVMLSHGKLIADDTPENLKKNTGSKNLREVFFAIDDRRSAS